MTTAAKRARPTYTYREYAELPDDGNRYELIDGEIYMSPPPALLHQMVCYRLAHALGSQLSEVRRLVAYVIQSPVGVMFDRTNFLEPDIVVVRRSRKRIMNLDGPVEGAPDLLVEVLSPSTRRRDLTLKKATYAAWRVPEYWIVDPKAGWVEVLRLAGETYRTHARHGRRATLRSVEFPTLRIPLARVFRPL